MYCKGKVLPCTKLTFTTRAVGKIVGPPVGFNLQIRRGNGILLGNLLKYLKQLSNKIEMKTFACLVQFVILTNIRLKRNGKGPALANYQLKISNF